MSKFAVTLFGLRGANFSEFLGFGQIAYEMEQLIRLERRLDHAINVKEIEAKTLVCASIR